MIAISDNTFLKVSLALRGASETIKLLTPKNPSGIQSLEILSTYKKLDEAAESIINDAEPQVKGRKDEKPLQL